MTETPAISRKPLNSKPTLSSFSVLIAAKGLLPLEEKQCTYEEEYSHLLACDCFTETIQNNQSNNAMRKSSRLSEFSSFIRPGMRHAFPALRPGTQNFANQIPAIAISSYSILFDGVIQCTTARDSHESLMPEPRFRTERVGFEPTRVLPLHDFESCAFNRALPPLQTLYHRQPTLKRHGLIA